MDANLYIVSSRLIVALLQVIHRPSIGKTKALQEPKAWESLLSSPNKSGPTSTPSLRKSSSLASFSTEATELSTTSTKVPHLIEAASSATRDRQTFAIDEAKDDEDVGDDAGAEDDAGVMDEVFLYAKLKSIYSHHILLSGGCVPPGPRFRPHGGG